MPWLPENEAVLLAKSAFYTLLGLAAVWAVLLHGWLPRAWHRFRSAADQVTRTVAACAALALPAVLLPVFVTWDPPSNTALAAEELPRAVCSTDGPVPVCVHPGMTRDLRATTALVSELVDLYGGRLPTDITGVSGRGVWYDRGQTDGPRHLSVLVYPSESIRDYVARDLGQALSGAAACTFDHPPDRVGVSSAVAVWIAHRMGMSSDRLPRPVGEVGVEAFQRLGALPDRHVSRWLREHRDELVECAVPASELP